MALCNFSTNATAESPLRQHLKEIYQRQMKVRMPFCRRQLKETVEGQMKETIEGHGFASRSSQNTSTVGPRAGELLDDLDRLRPVLHRSAFDHLE